MNYRVMKRPMFRIGGGVDSQGTGITSGMDTPRRGLVTEPGGYAGYQDYLESIPGLFKKRRETLEDLKGTIGPLALMKMAGSGAFENVGSIWDIPQAIGSPEAIGATTEGLATMPKIDLKMSESELEEAIAMAKLTKPEKGGMFSTRMKSETRIAAIQEEIRTLQKQKIDTTGLIDEELAEAEVANKKIDLQIADWRMRRRAYLSGGSLRQQALSIFYSDTPKGQAGGQPTEEDLQKIMEWLEPGNATGGIPNRVSRAGFQESFPGTVGEGQNVLQGEGAAVQEQAMEPAQNLQGITTPQRQEMAQDPYQILRQRLPPEIPDDIVRLIAYNKEAFQDFANIQTQDDVTAFNEKYGVQLVVDVGSV